MLAYHINQKEGTAKSVEIEPSLDELHKFVDCDCIDIVVRLVGGVAYNIVLDDEGLLRSDVRIGAVSASGDEVLAGNLLIFGVDDDGELRSLTPTELSLLEAHIYTFRRLDDKEGRVLTYD